MNIVLNTLAYISLLTFLISYAVNFVYPHRIIAGINAAAAAVLAVDLLVTN